MNYYKYIKKSIDNEIIKQQEDLITSYKDLKNINCLIPYVDKRKKKVISVDDVINHLSERDNLIISELNILGSSTLKILQKLQIIDRRRITLHLAKEKLILNLKDDKVFLLVYYLLDLEKSIKVKKLTTAKFTRMKKGTKVGRKPGKKTKSMFSPYKMAILKLHKQKIPKTKILEEIKKKDLKKNKNESRIKNSSVQALGQYIKKVTREKKGKVEIIIKDDSVKPEPFGIKVPIMIAKEIK